MTLTKTEYKEKLFILGSRPGKHKGAIRKLMIEAGKLDPGCGCQDTEKK